MEVSLAAKSIFITGCSRGIGLELVKQLLTLANKPKHIFATCRNVEKADQLKELAKNDPSVHLKDFDVTDDSSYPAIVSWVEQKVGDEGLNLLINNAGVFDTSNLDAFTRDGLISSYELNTVAPLMLARAFIPLLKKASLFAGGDNDPGPSCRMQDGPRPVYGVMNCSKASVINVTSRMGSIDDNSSGGFYPYRASKAALNMVTKCLSIDLKPHGILCGVIHPGWVQTSMGGSNAPLTTDVSVKNILKVIASLNQSDVGCFKSYDGSTIPW